MEKEKVDEKGLASRVEELEKKVAVIKSLTFGNGLSFGEWISRVVEIREHCTNVLAGAHAEEK